MSAEDRGTLQGLISYLGLSQREAAKVMGLSETTLSRKLAGEERYEVRDADLAPLKTWALAADQTVEGTLALWEKAKAERGPSSISPIDDFAGMQSRVALLVYRKDADLPAYAHAPHASMLRMINARIARGIGENAHLVMFDAEKYRAWLGARRDDQARRGEWAKEQVHPRTLGLDICKDSAGWWLLPWPQRGFVGVQGQEGDEPPAA